MSWALTKKATLLLSVGLVTLLAVLFSVPKVSADAITGTSNDGLATQTERWLRLRAIAKCFNDNDVGKNSYNDVIGGKFFDGGGVAIGYLNEDGKVSCDDGAFVNNTFGIIGYSDSLNAFCSVQPMASRGGADSSSSNNFNGCVNGQGDTFDMDSGAFDQGARQLSEFKTGYKAHATTPASWDPSPAMMYYIYKQSLVTFCGAELIGKYDEADKNNVDADQRKVVVNDVDLATGEIIRNVYRLNRDQTDKVDDIYVNNDMQNVSNVSCTQMAQKTWDYDKNMAAYVKDYNATHPDDIGSGVVVGNKGDGSGDTDAVCSAGALGWVFCPLSEFMSSTVTGVAGFLEGMLTYEPLIGSDKGKAIQAIWGVVLVIANVGLIFAFLAVVFSQATSVGISSYGIKKLLPRIIAAAVLMNLSFYICAVAVDITNILGISIKGIVDVGMGVVGSNNTGYGQAGADWGDWAITGTTAVLALAIGIGTGAIALLLPVLVSAVLAVLTAFLVLAAREVIITLLIILAPLAFLAWILPNTDNWFTKWRKLLTAMLLMFPMIMAVFYGSVLVSSLIMATHTNGTGMGGNINDFMVNLLAFGVLVIPLFSLPFIMKTAGGVLDRLGILVNNRNKGLVDRSRKKGQEMYNARKDTRRMNAFGEGRTINPWKANMRRQANRDHKRGLRKGIADENAQEFIARNALEGGQGRFSYSGRMVNSSNPAYIAAVQASAQATVDKQDRQSVANREILYKAQLKPGDNEGITRELKRAAELNDSVAVRALQNMYTYNGSSGIDEMRVGMKMIEDDVNVNQETLAAARKNLNETHGKTMKDKAYDMLLWSSQAGSGGKLAQYSSSQDTWKGLSVAEIAGQSGGSVQIASSVGAISPEKTKALLDDARVRERLSDKQVAALEQARQNHQKQGQAEATYAENITATQRREQDEAYETYRDNINPPTGPTGGRGGAS